VIDLSFAHPLGLAAALAAIAAAEWRRRRRPLPPALSFAFGRLLHGLPWSMRDRARRGFPALRVILLALLAVAAAGPTLQWEARRESRRGVDLLVLLDGSASMTVALPGSFASTRFEAARAEARAFADGRPDDRVGLLLFARDPRLVVPLTWDHALFDELLSAARPVAGGSEEDGTAIGVALAEAAFELRADSSPGPSRSRVVVLVTDGANTVDSISPEDGMRLCRDAAVRIHAISLGADAGPGGGAPSPERLLLRRLAAATGGRAFEANDRPALEEAWRSIDALEQAATVATTGRDAWPAASPLLAAALIAWVALAVVDRAWARSLP